MKTRLRMAPYVCISAVPCQPIICDSRPTSSSMCCAWSARARVGTDAQSSSTRQPTRLLGAPSASSRFVHHSLIKTWRPLFSLPRRAPFSGRHAYRTMSLAVSAGAPSSLISESPTMDEYLHHQCRDRIQIARDIIHAWMGRRLPNRLYSLPQSSD